MRLKEFQINPEQEAMELAYRRWLDFEKDNRLFTRSLEEPDRQTITNLSKAAKALQAALDPLIHGDQSPEMARLVCHMQTVELNAHPQSHYREMIESLYDPLRLLIEATRRESHAGRGADPFERRWIRTAADAWTELLNKKAASTFKKVLLDFQINHQDLPQVTSKKIDAALRHP